MPHPEGTILQKLSDEIFEFVCNITEEDADELAVRIVGLLKREKIIDECRVTSSESRANDENPEWNLNIMEAGL